MKFPPETWIWMPHPAHLIVSHDCRFHLATVVGDVIVSTVGEYFPDSETREILANCRGIKLQGRGDERRHDYMKKIGYEEIGCGRKYETMVFKAVPGKAENACCPFTQRDGRDLDSDGYNDASAAYAGHLAMCKKWADQE